MTLEEDYSKFSEFFFEPSGNIGITGDSINYEDNI